MGDLARDIFNFVNSLDCAFGFERSVKFTRHRLANRRYLFSFQGEALGKKGPAVLSRYLRSKAIPENALQHILSVLNEVDFVHMGYERSQHYEICKFYVEYPLESDAAEMLVYSAIKWCPEQPDKNVWTHYHLMNPESRDNLMQLIKKCFTPISPAISDMVSDMTEQFIHRVGELPMCLDVTETSNDRSSVDINFYDAQFEIGDYSDSLLSLGESLQLDSRQLEQALEEHANDVLGHIAGGVDRNEEAFLTLYYGVAGMNQDSVTNSRLFDSLIQ